MSNPGKGFMIILSAPSGAGKSTLANHLLQAMAGVSQSVSTTTRAPRPGEVDGLAYYFVDQATFRARVERGDFLEWAEVFGHYYGTDRNTVERVLARGENVLLVIDWQGARQVRESCSPGEVVSIAVLPPSRQALQDRLEGRGSDDAQVVARRMAQAGAEAAHWQEYDYLLINNELTQACRELIAIVTAERLRRERVDPEKVQAILTTFSNGTL